MGVLSIGLLLLPLVSGVFGNCPLVQAPQWGTVRERVLKDGTLQTVYSCEPGRRLKGHKILTCTANGWNHPIPKCVPYDNRFRHFRNDLYLGDDPISTTPVGEKAARERLKARKRIGELKKRRKAKERKQRQKQVVEKSLAGSPLASTVSGLNETIMSRLDLSCFMKARKKGLAKAPPLENAYPAKYARFVSFNPETLQREEKVQVDALSCFS
nr:PREDICTED: uncharacterized protein LOC105663712 [Megachile rotundata]